MEAKLVFRKGESKKVKKISIVGDKYADSFVRDAKVEQLSNSYIGEVHYSRIIRPEYVSIWKLFDDMEFYGGSIIATYHDQVKKLMEEYKPDYVIFALGQTDLEFEYYYRAIILGEDVDNFIDETIEKYHRYIETIQNEYGGGVIIKGVNPSVLLHNSDSRYFTSRMLVKRYGGVDKEKNLEMTNQFIRGLVSPEYQFERRFELLERFNEELRRLAKAVQGLYFDLWDELIDKDTGSVRLQYMPARQTNCLVDSNELRQLHYDKLREITQFLEKNG